MFIWDESKREKVISEHKVDFALLTDIFDDAYSIDFEDYEHSDDVVTHYGVIGKTAEYGLVVLIYAVIDEETIKFITARRAEKWMVNDYERQSRRY